MTLTIKLATRHEDTVARLGGDEFAVILSPVKHLDLINDISCRIHEHFEDKHSFENHTIELSASLGNSLHPVDGQTPDQLIEIADQRMYQSKHRFYSNKVMS